MIRSSQRTLRRLAVSLAMVLVLVAATLATPIQWVGNTKLWLNVHALPSRGAFIEAHQTVTITTESWPIGDGQGVVAVVTSDRYQNTMEQRFTFDFNAGNNSHWYVVIGPFPRNTWVDFYLRAQGTGGPAVYDNNGQQDFGFMSRPSPRFRNGPILQWFETDYRTILKRLPEVVLAGYSAIYLPSPAKSGGGGLSVGYNPFDHFDLGDRMQKGSVRTRYGTTQELTELIAVAKRLGLEVYCDLVLNHADNRASTAINRYPQLIPEDFHIQSSANTSNGEVDFNTATAFGFDMLNHDLVGLADYAHEDGNATQTGTFTLPTFATFNGWGKPSFVRNPLNPQYYPGASSPYTEDVRQYLKRWAKWLTLTIGFDGFRLDAVKHIPPAFLGWAPDQPLSGTFAEGDTLPFLYSVNPNLYVFGEDYSSGGYELREYAKTGMNLLDFPLVFKLRDIFNSQGFGDLGAALSNGYGLGSSTGLPYENAGLGADVSVGFVQSHDDGPPQSDNLAHAFVLTRLARPKVYYDGNNVQPGDWGHFPKPGRADAIELEGATSRIVDARNRFGRGVLVNRYVSNRLYIYERQVNGTGLLLVGLNNRGDSTPLTQSVSTAFLAGSVLTDLSGQMPDVTVGADRKVTITVPSNSSPSATNNGKGYVLYSPVTPRAVQGAAPLSLTSDATRSDVRTMRLLPTSYTAPAGTYGTAQSYSAYTVSARSISVVARTDSSGVSAFLKLDQGLPIAGVQPLLGTPEGLTDGFVPMRKLSNGYFVLDAINLDGLADGLHVMRSRVFCDSFGGPGLYSEFVMFIYVRRGLGGMVTVDGDLSDLGTPVASQQRTPSSNLNRLDAMYAMNDDRHLYLGIAGRVDTSEGLTNGLMMYLDADPDQGTGIRDFSALGDDSGPAARLLSNPRVAAPVGFGAEYGLSVFRQSALGSSPEASTVGTPVLTPSIGAQAGLFGLVTANPSVLAPKRAVIAFQQRTNKSDPVRGMEAAIPLRELFSGTLAEGAKIGLIAGLGSTGESGATLPASDPLRASLGGRPAPNAWMSNQFLPSQLSVVSDPGTNTVTLGSRVVYTLQFAQSVTPAQCSVLASTMRSNGRRGSWSQTVTLTNTKGQPIAGPVSLLVRVPSGVHLVNRTDVSLRDPSAQVAAVSPSTLAVGASCRIVLEFSGGVVAPSPTYEVRSGRGVL